MNKRPVCYCGKRPQPNPANASYVRDGVALCRAECCRAYDLTASAVINAIIEGGHDVLPPDTAVLRDRAALPQE